MDSSLFNLIIYENITLLKAKVGILAVSCLSITALFACVDKDARNDLSPNLPTDQAQNGDFGDQGGGSDQGLNFPVFDDGVLAFPGAEGYGKMQQVLVRVRDEKFIM